MLIAYHDQVAWSLKLVHFVVPIREIKVSEVMSINDVHCLNSFEQEGPQHLVQER